MSKDKRTDLYELRTEYLHEPLGIDAQHPRLLWKLKSDRRGVKQKSYQIRCTSDGNVIWNSGVVNSSNQMVRYKGKELASRQKVEWTIQSVVEDENGETETVSAQSHFEMGLLKQNDWKAKWISHPKDNRETRLVPVFRKRFIVKKGLRCARLYITSHGIYDCSINGEAVSEEKFAPGLTSYYHRIQYRVYDVTDLLQEGENDWTTVVGDGWWRWNNNFGSQLGMYGQLELHYEEEDEIVGTDESFVVGTGNILTSDIQFGECFDARICTVQWHQVILAKEHTDAKLIASRSVQMCEKETFPAQCFRDAAGRVILDFGQNLAGYVKMRLRNTKAGQVIHLQHGEDIDADGKFSVKNINSGLTYKPVFQEITYICKGAKMEEYVPSFSIFGFRYVLLEGYEEESILKGDFIAAAVYSDLMPTGEFTCSNPLINQLAENSRWSQKGNFLDCPVDCPTRERNTWTGDAQIYAKTAAYFMDVYPMFEKWFLDQGIEQYESGKVGITFPSTSSVHDPAEFKYVREKDPRMALAGPEGNGNEGEDSVGWGDSAVWLPYTTYLMYGDKQILKNQYQTAKRWLEFSLRCMRDENPLYLEEPYYHTQSFGEPDSNYIYDTRFHYGEWNEPLPPSPLVVEFFKSGKSGSEFVEFMKKYGKPEVATAYTKRSCDNMVYMAETLGENADAQRYRLLSKRIQYCYDKYLIAEDGTIEPGHQAAYIRALALDLAGDKKQALVIKQLKKELEMADYHLNTGFLSTAYLLPTLCDNGMTEEAFRILEQTSAPGWLHPILLGATTILESWTGMDAHKDSYNHYSFGAVCEFLFGYVAGIRPMFEAPGFQEFELHPILGGSLTHAEAGFESPYGCIKSAWEKQENTYTYRCEIPVNTVAHLTLPDGRKMTIGSGYYEFEGAIL